MQGTGAFLARRFCFTRSLSAASRRPPAVTVKRPVSAPSPSSSGRTFSDCNKPRRAISSARSSTLTPALIRLTFTSDATNLSSAISRALVITIFAISKVSATSGREPVSQLLTRHENPRCPLTLYPTQPNHHLNAMAHSASKLDIENNIHNSYLRLSPTDHSIRANQAYKR